MTIANAIAEARRQSTPRNKNHRTPSREDYFAAASRAEAEGVKLVIIPTGDTVRVTALSTTVPGLAYEITPIEGTCSCPGFARHGICKHYALFLREVEAGPWRSSGDDPRVMMGELYAFRARYTELKRDRSSGSRAIEAAVAQLMAELEVWLLGAEADGLCREYIRDAWKGAAQEAALAAAAINREETHDQIMRDLAKRGKTSVASLDRETFNRAFRTMDPDQLEYAVSAGNFDELTRSALQDLFETMQEAIAAAIWEIDRNEAIRKEFYSLEPMADKDRDALKRELEESQRKIRTTTSEESRKVAAFYDALATAMLEVIDRVESSEAASA